VHKDIRSIMKTLKKQGWKWVATKSGHYLAIPLDKTKAIVTISSTPGGSAWMHKVLGDLRRSGAVI
jgi:predicted RNA binding protein YcfA (HicA-like mRNA interferase family)